MFSQFLSRREMLRSSSILAGVVLFCVQGTNPLLALDNFSADFNGSGDVDILNDAFAFIGGFGAPSTTFSEGDANGDGRTTIIFDGTALVEQLNGPGGVPGTTTGSTATATATMTAVSVSMLLSRRAWLFLWGFLQFIWLMKVVAQLVLRALPTSQN